MTARRQVKKIVKWTLITSAALLVIALVGGYLFLRTKAFQQLALRKIAEEVDESTGGKTTIRSLDFSLSTLTAHLYGITIHGRENPGQPPLLQVDKLAVGLRIQSAIHRKVSLSELIIEHPVVHLRVDKFGNSNLPVVPPSKSSSNTSVFDLAVSHAQLTRGEVSYNDRQTRLDADLYNLGTDIHFDSRATRYDGSISYDHGRLRYGDYPPLSHSLQAKFNATPQQFTLASATAKIGKSVVNLQAAVNNYSDPTAAGEYDIRIDTQDFASFAPAYKPVGDVVLTGKIDYKNLPHQPLIRGLAIDGQLASEVLSAVVSQGRVAVRKVRGNYTLANGALRANGIELESFGGRLNADLSMRNLDTTPDACLRASLHGVSLRALQQTLHAGLKQAIVSGILNGTADASWRGSVSNVRAHSDLTVTGAASATSADNKIPVDGVIHANYDGAHSTLTLRQSSVRVPSASLTADGEVSQHSALRVQVTAGDLHQLETLASTFLGSGGMTPVTGSAKLTASIRGSISQPQIAAQVSAQNLTVQGSEWSSLLANLDASPHQVALTKGSLVNAKHGRASFTASVVLRDWAYQPSAPLKASLSMQRMSISDLEHMANAQYPVSGDLNVNVSLAGSQLDPQGSGTIQIANAKAYGETVQTFAAQFHADHGSVVSSLHVAVPAGSASADFSYAPKTRAYCIKLDAPSIVLAKLHSVQEKNLALSGTLSASASGQGTLDDPQLNAALQLPELTMKDKSISNVQAELKVANHNADLTLNSKVVGSGVQAKAHVSLVGDYQTDASIDTTAVPLDVLLATYMPSVPQGVKGETELHATLKGPLKDTTQLEAHLAIPKLDATYQSLEIGLASPLHADYAHSIVTVQPTEIKGTDTSLRIQGSVPLAGNTAPSLTAQGSLDVRILKIFSPDTQSAGTVAFDVHATGTARAPWVDGQIHLQNVSLGYAGAPVGVEKLNGTLDLNQQRVQISDLTCQIGGGNASAGGSIVYDPSFHFNLALQGKSIRLLYPDGVRTLLDSNLLYAGNMQSSTLSGRVLIDGLSFTPGFDLSSFADQFSSSTATPAQPGFADTLKLAVAVQSKDNLSASSTQVSIEGAVNLQVGGTAADPVITGRTDLSSGELFYRNVRYQLERGIITFDDPTQTNPALNVSASTKVEQYNLTLNLRGTFDKLTTSYTSDPPLSTADIINLIARGQTTEEAAGSSQSTDSIIASQAASQVAGGLQKLVGISSLQVTPPIGSNNQNPSATVAIQQRVTNNFLFTFSTDVSQPGYEVVQGDYQISKRWSVGASRDQLGGVTVDARLHTHF